MSYRSPDRMPCHISDGPQTPEDDVLTFPWDADDDEVYEEWRQQEVDLEKQPLYGTID